ncbi:MAG: hypothetical protein IPP94_16935 [Ignavibacteria bacterium]|nr:hypothetical protein [Ignavibacteria bacterium]
MLAAQQSELREIILAKIATILTGVYNEPVPTITLGDVLARTAFKADPLLNELRLALERLERGDFGRCIFCKEDIPYPILSDLPTAHFCDRCANVLRCRTHSAVAMHA